MSQLPSRVIIREVGPRDGFQNEPEVIATADKIRLIDQLMRTGMQRIEAASFVRPDVLPQLADGIEVLNGIDVPEGVSVTVLVPNERGLDNALKVRDRFDTVSVFASASETHNMKNVNMSIEKSLDGLSRVIPRALEAGLKVHGVFATAFGCPYEGDVPIERVMELSKWLVDQGCTEIGFGDTTGMANPVYVHEFFTRAAEELGSDMELTAHFHNTRGQGLANVVAAMQAGCHSFESSFGELGGCPVPKGATGNIASEDLVSMLHEMGVQTGIDLGLLIEAAREVQDVLGRRLTSHTIVAGPVDWHR